MTLKIDFKIFLFAILLWLTDQIEIYAIIMIFCIMHEIGHLLAGKLLGYRCEKIEVMPLGLSISFKLNIDDYNRKIKKANLLEIKKIIIAMAGPAVNVFAIILFYIFFRNCSNITLYMNTIYANMMIFLFNLIPIFPLDGGRILFGVLYILFGKRMALEISNYISNFILVVLLIANSFLILEYKNIALFFISIFLSAMVVRENKVFKLKNKIYKAVEEVKKENTL